VITAALLVAAAASVPLAAAPAGTGAARVRIERAVTRALGSAVLRQALVSVTVRSLESGRVIYTHNGNASVTPASAMKVVTTAAALDAFGPDARFRTTVEAAARPNESGGIAGDLYLVGGGDPSLSHELAARPEFGVFDPLAEALRSAGVRRVDGKLVGCDPYFVGDRRGADWSWEDLVWWYGAEVAGLTFADGAVNLKVSPGPEPGAPLSVERHPASAYYRVESTAMTCGPGATPGVTMNRALGTNVIELSGCLPVGWPPLERWLAVEDPVLYATTVMAEALKARGIDVVGGVARCTAPPAGLAVLATYEGEKVAEILKDVNKPSHNVRAEMLLRLLGQKVKGEGSAKAGSEAVVEFLKAQDVDVDGWEVQDGSGLSRTDLVTTVGLSGLLVAMHRHPHAAAFRASLPVAGLDGTLKSRLSGPRTRGRVQAKTGRMRHSCALVGYAAPRRG
jgi:D-alanyl-D-alanine carboxypeptidase/D-alanyl-D-alanine-endopeptidase (penicillin-binding protein 4)